MRYLAIVIALVLGACSGSDTQVITRQPITITAPVASSMTLRELNWQINKDPDQTTYQLNDQGFKDLFYNLTEFERYILEQQAVITFYQNITSEKEQSR